MGLEAPAIAAIAATVSAGAAVTSGVLNYEASSRQAAAQETLRSEQAARLRNEQDSAKALAAKQATTGQTFGGERAPAAVAATGLGFGTGNQAPTGYGRSQLTGGI